jgi:penicillin-binding protein 1A
MVSGLFMIGFLVVCFLVVLFSKELPDAQQIRSIELEIPLRVYSADELLISEFGNERRKPIPYTETPQLLIDAVLASEDDGFFEHGGIDIKGLVRAALSNAKSGRSGQGASTITMQVARNFFLTPEKTYSRKIKEILVSIRLEQILSKEEILSLYLNKIFLGHRSYGFGAAAEVYYGKELKELDIAQIAMLAGLPKAPSSYNPLRNAERAQIRRNYVLSRLYELGKITEEQFDLSKEAPISATKHSTRSDLDAPHIAEMVRSFVIEKYGEEAYLKGLNVYTTIYSKQQVAAQESLRNGLQAYDRRHGFRGAITNIDLTKIIEGNPNETELAESYENILRPYPASHEQIPVIVLDTQSDNARLWSDQHGEITLQLADSKWAKRHKTANLVGDSPTKMSSLLKAGDIIYVQPKEIVAPNKEGPSDITTPSQWRLSQIPNVGGALISMDPSSGQIISLVGGYDFFLNKYNRAIQSIRQPGSNIKPFIYSAAIDQGFTPASLISGAPIVITDQAHGTLWRPENYSGKFYGLTRMRQALAKSMNLVSIRILRAIGIPVAREYVSRFGIDMSRFSPSLTMALGSGGATPMEVLNAYSVLANGGYKVEPYFIERITDRDGITLFEAPKPQFCDECYEQYLPEPEADLETIDDRVITAEDLPDVELNPELDETVEELDGDQENLFPNTYSAPRVMSHSNNFLTVSMMQDVIRRGTARRAQTLKRSDLAGKTGTTNDYVDAWFTGFNSKVATTVWVGFDEPSTMGRGEAGSLTALPIWVDYMKTGLEGIAQDSTALPAYIEEFLINRDTGKTTDELDPQAITEFNVITELTPEYEMFEQTSVRSVENTDEQESLDDNTEIDQVEPELQERLIEDSDNTEDLF